MGTQPNKRMRTILVRIAELLPIVGLAAFGGLTRTLYGKAKGEPYDWSIAIPEIIIAIFSGLLIHWVTLELGLSENLRTAAIALAGYCARSVMAILNAVFITFVKRNITIDKK
jgi:hypothetical protein